MWWKGFQGSQHEGDEGGRRHYILDYVGKNIKVANINEEILS